VEHALVVAANELESDTDTIATMAGAILGSVSSKCPDGELQDDAYISQEAARLARVAFGKKERSFAYPDLALWEPPTNLSDGIKELSGSVVLVGFGKIDLIGQEYAGRDAIWQWATLPHGQQILSKRRKNGLGRIKANQIPQQIIPVAKENVDVVKLPKQERFALDVSTSDPSTERSKVSPEVAKPRMRFPGVDEATNEIIRSGFDNALIGRMMNLCIEETRSIEIVVSLSAIIAKAKLARLRR
jgi:hypothetical protein